MRWMMLVSFVDRGVNMGIWLFSCLFNWPPWTASFPNDLLLCEVTISKTLNETSIVNGLIACLGNV